MSTANHTRGPWAYQEDSDAYTHIVRGPNNRFICQLNQTTSAEIEANARLIAAAPDMLSALRSSRDVLARAIKAAAPDLFESDEDVNEHLTIKRMDAAIARAIGGAA